MLETIYKIHNLSSNFPNFPSQLIGYPIGQLRYCHQIHCPPKFSWLTLQSICLHGDFGPQMFLQTMLKIEEENKIYYARNVTETLSISPLCCFANFLPISRSTWKIKTYKQWTKFSALFLTVLFGKSILFPTIILVICWFVFNSSSSSHVVSFWNEFVLVTS